MVTARVSRVFVAISIAFCASVWVTPCLSEDGDPAGVEAGTHWAFRPVEKTQVPGVEDSLWPRGDVDRFVLARLEQSGLRPRSDADRYTWLRRVSFDLTGLPPTVNEIHDFEADRSAKAFGRVVDRLLSSHAFGERWARHWMDLVGYADEVGTSNRPFTRYAWRYRDYLIHAFNSDKPFDRFIREQIAGDHLPYETVGERRANLTATGFLLLGDIQIVEADKEKLRFDVIDQQLDKVGKAFLGMSLHCARCHDHKFDPIAQRDYYAMAGFFHSTESLVRTGRGVWSDIRVIELPETEEEKAEREERVRLHNEKLAGFEEELEKLTARKDELAKLLEEDAGNEDRIKERDEVQKRHAELTRIVRHAKFFAPGVPLAHGVRDVRKPSDMRLAVRGNPHQLDESVPRGFLQAISRDAVKVSAGESGRKELAEWIVDGENPLTARVIVNRVWQKIFGVGLVSPVDNFGLRGSKPTHPELLDFLASRFQAESWSTKRLIRSLVLSRTYGMDSTHDPRAFDKDPDNKLLWRMNSRRLEAESLRDAFLLVSGDLDRTVGRSAFAFEYVENSSNLTDKVNPPIFEFQKWRPEQPYQRTLYLPVVRQGRQPEIVEIRNIFDFQQPADYAGERLTTAVATQALYMMNSPDMKQNAERLVKALERDASEMARRLERLWLRVLNRPITSDEKKDAEGLLSRAGDEGWRELCHAVLISNEFLMRR